MFQMDVRQSSTTESALPFVTAAQQVTVARLYSSNLLVLEYVFLSSLKFKKIVILSLFVLIRFPSCSDLISSFKVMTAESEFLTEFTCLGSWRTTLGYDGVSTSANSLGHQGFPFLLRWEVR